MQDSFGSLKRKAFEVAAGAVDREAIADPLAREGASMASPLPPSLQRIVELLNERMVPTEVLRLRFAMSEDTASACCPLVTE